MSDILFITTALPFPPRQGVELPLSKVAEYLSVHHSVDFLVITTGVKSEEDHAARRKDVPTTVGNVWSLSAGNRPRLVSIIREVIGVTPSFMLDGFDRDEVRRILAGTRYDAVWCSPIGCLGLVEECRRAGIWMSDTIVLGHNDPEVALYWDAFKQLFTGHVPFEVKRIARGLRMPWILLYERRYLRNLAMIHVQTPMERTRMIRVLGRRGRDVVVVEAPNGRNTALDRVDYAGIDSKRVLYMTHLAGGRRRESDWFIKRVWPLVLDRIPDAELWLVGTPPADEAGFRASLPERVRVCGYVEDLSRVYESVAVSVVPTHHGTGWANRVADAVAAGIPLVGCSEPLRTIPGMEVGTHALSGDTTAEFAHAVTHLLKDRALRSRLSQNAKELSRSLPDWEETVRRLGIATLAIARRGGAQSVATGE